jgi:hypothetical protein
MRTYTAYRNLTFHHYSSIINWGLHNVFWTYFRLNKQRHINCLGYSGRLVNRTRTWKGVIVSCTCPKGPNENMETSGQTQEPGTCQIWSRGGNRSTGNPVFPSFGNGTVGHSHNFCEAPNQTIIAYAKPKPTRPQLRYNNNNNNNNKYKHGYDINMSLDFSLT